MQPFLPNSADAAITEQAEPDSTDFEVLSGAVGALTGVVSSCVVSEDPVTPDMTVDVAAGEIRVDGKPVTVSAQANNVITAADGSNLRIDLVSLNSSGTVVVTDGTPAAEPVAPSIPADSVALAFVYVPASDTAITDAQIVDKRRWVAAATVFDVLEYGATGDGSTDDTTAIQAAATAANAVGGTVQFPYGESGQYKIATTITLDVETSVEFLADIDILNTTASTGFAFEVTGNGSSDTAVTIGRFTGGRIDCNASGNSGILLEDTYGYVVQGVKVRGNDVGDYGIAIRYGSAGSAYNSIRDCHLVGLATAGIDFDGGASNWSSRNTISGVWAYGCGIGFRSNQGGTHFVDIATENCTTGIDLTDSTYCTIRLISESDTTSLDLGTGSRHDIFLVGEVLDAGTASHCTIRGVWDDDDVVNKDTLYGDNIVISQGHSGDTDKTLVSAPLVQQHDWDATRYFTEATWPTAGDRAVAYLDFGDLTFTGVIEVEITGRWNTGSAAYGLVRKVMSFAHSSGGTSVSNYASDIEQATGEIVDHFTIGDAEIHTTNNFRIPIYRLDTTTSTTILIKVRILSPSSVTGAFDALEAITFVDAANASNSAERPYVTINSDVTLCTGTGTPESNVTGSVGDIYLRTDGGTATTLYVKESGTGTTGWRQAIVAATETSGTDTLDWTDSVVNVDTSGGAATITLPDNADYDGKNYLIRRDGASAVTINRAGSDTFDDAATSKTLGSDSASIGILSIGDGEWKIVGTSGTVT